MNDTPKWPARCLIENASLHPTQPWLAVACTDAEGERGAVMVFDVQAGSLSRVALREGYVGWTSPGLLRWHPDGRRLATNIDTNGIALLDGTEWIGEAFPDETRDGGVEYVWIDERMFTQTGAFFEISPGEPQFDLPTLDGPSFDDIEWNASIGAVVGRVGRGVAAYDPRQQRVVYESSLGEHGKSGTPRVSPDGRWFVIWQHAIHPAPDQLVFIDGDTGKVHGIRRPFSPRVDKLVWGPEGALAVSSYVHHIGGPSSGRRVDLFFRGELRESIDLGKRRVESSNSVAEASAMAWSPDAHGLALLLDEQQVSIHDAHSGASIYRFAAPAPAIPKGLPDHYAKGHRPSYGFPGDLMWAQQQRIVRIAPHFVSFWSLDGQKIAEFVVP